MDAPSRSQPSGLNNLHEAGGAAKFDEICHSPSLSHSQESSFDNSEAASPRSPTFSISGHTGAISAASTPASTPSVAPEPLIESSLAPKKPTFGLPNLTEDPLERENGDFEMVSRPYSFGTKPCPLCSLLSPNSNEALKRCSTDCAADMGNGRSDDIIAVRESLVASLANEDGLARGLQNGNQSFPGLGSKRRRSGDSTLSNVVGRLATRFPSLPRRKGSARNSLVVQTAGNSEAASPVVGRSRSNSRARSLFKGSRGGEDVDSDPEPITMSSNAIGTIAEDDDQENKMDGQLYFHDNAGFLAQGEEIQRTSTPLLPLQTDAIPEAPETTSSSPLPEPPIAYQNESFSSTTTTEGSASQYSSVQSSAFGIQSPALSVKASWDHFPEVRKQSFSNSPKLGANDDDAWDEKLGHANFYIQPAPYTPEKFGVDTCRQLLSDWNVARAEFSKHLARTNIHYGQTSKTYRLTEEKWSEIDSLWRKKYEQAIVKSSETGEPIPFNEPSEPSPVTIIPAMQEYKFPKIGDEDIVGPMEVRQIDSQLQRRSSKKAGFMKMIGGLQFPSSTRNRSNSRA